MYSTFYFTVCFITVFSQFFAISALPKIYRTAVYIEWRIGEKLEHAKFLNIPTSVAFMAVSNTQVESQ